jgi:hypothetical protein
MQARHVLIDFGDGPMPLTVNADIVISIFTEWASSSGNGGIKYWRRQ